MRSQGTRLPGQDGDAKLFWMRSDPSHPCPKSLARAKGRGRCLGPWVAVVSRVCSLVARKTGIQRRWRTTGRAPLPPRLDAPKPRCVRSSPESTSCPKHQMLLSAVKCQNSTQQETRPSAEGNRPQSHSNRQHHGRQQCTNR